MKNLKRISLMLCFIVAGFIFTACKETKQRLVLSADKQMAHRGEVVTCLAVLEEDGKTKSSDSIIYEIVSGESNATLVENKLTINADAQPGVVIKVVAKLNDLTSNAVEIVVSVPLTDIAISANGVTNIVAGSSATLTKTLNPTVSDVSIEDVEWVIAQGEDLCSISGDELRVNSNVSTGEVIKVKAVYETLESNVLTFTVGYPLQDIQVSIMGSANIPNGQTRPITTTLTPSNATNASNITWEFIEGEDLCIIMNDFIYIDENAPIGSVIKFKAVSGTVESDEVSVVVGTPIETITLSATAGLEDGSVTSRVVNLKAGVTPSNASMVGITWSATTIVDDQTIEYVESIVDGVLTLKSGIPVGTIIKVTASSGSVSGTLDLTYGIPAETITLSATGLEDGAIVTKVVNLKSTVTPSNATIDNVIWSATTIVGDQTIEYVESIVDGVLTLKSGIPVGTIIKVTVACGSASDELVLTYGIYASSVVASANSYEIVKGTTAILSTEVAPANATDKTISWQIIEGGEYVANITNNALLVKSDATTGATIKVKAIAVGAESEILTFTVMPTQNEILASQYFIDVEDEITLDKNANSSKVLTATIYNKLFDEITDEELIYTVVEGAEYVEVIPNGKKCSFNILGHGTAVLEVAIKDMDVKKHVAVNVIVPPEMVELPEVFTQRANYAYNFSKVDDLPFVATAFGTNVCKDIKYTFAHEDGTNGDAVATYTDGKITFNKTGKITVTATSDSGSAVETSSNYTFNINEGINVYTYYELQLVANRSDYTGQIINIVALEDPDGDAQVYGYDLVPEMALKPQSEQTFEEIRTGKSGVNGLRINFVCKSAYINGNNHRLNLSQVRVITEQEMKDYRADYLATYGEEAEWNGIFGILSIIPWHSTTPAEELEGDYTVNIYDLEVIGNNSVDFNGFIEGKKTIGVVHSGIAIGSTYSVESKYTIDIKNVSVSNCESGINLRNIPSGTMENIFISNCFENGMTAAASIVTLRNMKFASCGASAIELTPPNADKAGADSNQYQHITFDGYFDMNSNLNNGFTTFFEKYVITHPYSGERYEIPTIVKALVSQFNENQLSHMCNEKEEFGFVSFVLADMTTFSANLSQYSYPDSEDVNRGIINAKNLPTNGIDTTHQYIELDVDLSSFGLGNAGKVILYNHHYKG